MGVGHLGDRIAGGGPFAGAWPRGERELSRTEKIELQERLIARGYDTGATDGVIGPNTIAAIRAYQAAPGPDARRLRHRLAAAGSCADGRRARPAARRPDRRRQHLAEGRRRPLRRGGEDRRGEPPAHLRRLLQGPAGGLGEGARPPRHPAQQQFAYTTGKNSTDITLVIDAMDLLHSGRFDGFCLVSSDSDFTRLAARIREQGIDVYGIGRQKTPEAFRQACTRFIFTENFVAEEPARRRPPSRRSAPLAEAVELIRKALDQMEEDAEGWFQLGAVGQRMQQPLARVRHPHLRPRQAQRPRRGHRPLRDRPRRPARPPAPEARPPPHPLTRSPAGACPHKRDNWRHGCYAPRAAVGLSGLFGPPRTRLTQRARTTRRSADSPRAARPWGNNAEELMGWLFRHISSVLFCPGRRPNRAAAARPRVQGQDRRDVQGLDAELSAAGEGARKAARTCCSSCSTTSGFGMCSTFGGPVPTPHMDKLAEQRAEVHPVPHHGPVQPDARRAARRSQPPQHRHRASSSRWAPAIPGYTGIIPRSTALVPQMLRDNGYATAHVRQVAQHAGAGHQPGRAVRPLADRAWGSTTSTASTRARRTSTTRRSTATRSRCRSRSRRSRATTSPRT